jgi:23S rRNA (uracil1939-C5)-methyltransferase
MIIRKNDTLSLLITDWAEKGLAYGLVDDIPILIPNTVPGDTVSALITKISATKGYAKCLEITHPSPQRNDSKCPVSIRCGGCQLWHVKYDEQLLYKRVLVTQLFEEKEVALPTLNVIGMDTPEHYRNRAQYAVSKDNEGYLRVGLTAARSQDVVDTGACYIQDELSNQALTLFRQWLSDFEVPIFNPNGTSAGIAHFVTRVGVGTGQLMVAISSTKKELPFIDEFINSLKTIPALKSVIFDLNANAQWQALGGNSHVLWGEETITEKIDGLSFELSLSSFFQANSTQISQLWQTISDLGEFKKTDSVLDLYCGTGSISLHLARSVKSVIGVETHSDAVKNAIKNAEINAMSNCTFSEKDVSDFCLEFTGHVDVVVLDPPRKGLDRMVVEALAEIGVTKIVYVSCNPESLVRDIAFFKNRGYSLSKATIVDMFPQTYHLETVVLLTK